MGEKITIEVEQVKNAFVVYENTDSTEGRGWEFPTRVSFNYTTAVRLAKGRGVQGSMASIKELPIYRIDGRWYSPVIVEESTKEDEKKDAKRKAKEDALQKARELGFSPEEIQALKE